MKNNSTSLEHSGMTIDKISQPERNPAPRRSTIAFIRQFARAYQCPASSLPAPIAGFVAN